MTAIQRIIRGVKRRPLNESPVWIEFQKLFDYVEHHSIAISAPTAQELIKLLLTIQRRYSGMIMVSYHCYFLSCTWIYSF